MTVINVIGLVLITILLLFETLFLGYIFLVAVMFGINLLGWTMFIVFIILDITVWTSLLMLVNTYL